MSRKWHGTHPRGSAWEVPRNRATAAATSTRKIFMGGCEGCLLRIGEDPRSLDASLETAVLEDFASLGNAAPR
jgi:hypothetical protein